MNTNIDKFKKDGYCVVKSAISDELRDFVTQYALFDEMQTFDGVGDEQIPNSHRKYADPAMETVLLTLQKTMEENTGLKLHPTYSYYRVYRNGDELKVHKDRPSCEISCTLCFNYDYDDNNYSWPIFMNGNPVVLKPGDMVIYRGCDLDHWREKFNYFTPTWHVQGFFHYVDANGPYAEYKYDERTTIGALKFSTSNDNEVVSKTESNLPSYIEFIK
jgi:hypothetical protein